MEQCSVDFTVLQFDIILQENYQNGLTRHEYVHNT